MAPNAMTTLEHARERRWIEAPVPLQAFLRPCAQLFQRPASPRDADDGNVEDAAANQPL
jgi:hypothetical protein